MSAKDPIVANSEEWKGLGLEYYPRLEKLILGSGGCKLGIIALLIFTSVSLWMESNFTGWVQLSIIFGIVFLASIHEFLNAWIHYAKTEKTNTDQDEYDHASGAERQAGGA